MHRNCSQWQRAEWTKKALRERRMASFSSGRCTRPRSFRVSTCSAGLRTYLGWFRILQPGICRPKRAALQPAGLCPMPRPSVCRSKLRHMKAAPRPRTPKKSGRPDEFRRDAPCHARSYKTGGMNPPLRPARRRRYALHAAGEVEALGGDGGAAGGLQRHIG